MKWFKIRNQVEKTFTKWWFDNVLRDAVSNFLPIPSKFHMNSIFLSPLGVYAQDDINRIVSRCLSSLNSYMKTYTKYVPPPVIDNNTVIFCNENIRVGEYQMKVMRDRLHTDASEMFIAMEVLMLHSLGSLMEHLSLPPHILNILGINVELFGTPMNTTLKRFCSPFYDVDHVFGSLGSFMKYEMENDTLYTFNPPYDDDLMHECAIRLINQMKNLSGVHILCLLPVWDADTQREMKVPVYSEDRFRALDTLCTSSYLRRKAVLEKNMYPYFNYFDSKYVSVSHTHMLVLSTDDTLPDHWNVDAILNVWNK